ncbi:MAG: endonuclease/exonuclease/phosphatase family protein [Anaerolinea sp.]|nr:endonuclease/exonuclease/phosphatase family protein [Anaerolinea sp.]
MTENFTLLTLNLRHDADRWLERRPLIADVLAEHSADVIAFQEVALRIQQAHLIAADIESRLGKRTYEVHVQSKWGDQAWEGIAFLTKLPVVEVGAIDLPEGHRVAQRVRVLKDGVPVDVVNTHLHHLPEDDESIRAPQAQAILDWIAQLSGDGQARRWLITGDFNAQPHTETIQQIAGRYKSAYATLHGADPVTFPTPLVREGYPPFAIDYIFYDPQYVEAVGAGLVGTQPDPRDANLYPSDHFGITAEFLLR